MPDSVQTSAARGFFRQALLVALDGSAQLALALGGRLFVELTGAQLGDDAGLLTGALEATHCDFKRLVLFNAYGRHWDSSNKVSESIHRPFPQKFAGQAFQKERDYTS